MVADDPESFADLVGHYSPEYGQLQDNMDKLARQMYLNYRKLFPCICQNLSNQAQNQPEIVTGTGYNGHPAVELRTFNTTMTVDARGNQITQEVYTSVFFSNEIGYEGQFLGATQTTYTTKRSPTGKKTETVGEAALTRDVAQAAVGNNAFLQGMQRAANANEQDHFNHAIINDAKAHPGKYVAAAGGIASLVLGPAGYPVAAGVARAIGLAGALYDRLIN